MLSRVVRRATSLWLPIALLAIAGLFFAEVLRGMVYYPGDTARLYLPQRLVLQRALQAHTLPWWTSSIGAGYPLLAEGEIGAFYPPNLLLAVLLPAEIGLTLTVLLHYLITGLGFYLFARKLQLAQRAAFFGSLVWTLGGFNIAHLSHVSIMATAAWLPWQLAFTRQLLRPASENRASPWPTALGLGLVTGMQLLAGHPQMALLGLIVLAAYALFLGTTSGRSHPGAHQWPSWVGAMALGLALGLPQLIPTMQLSALSQRAGGLDSAFFTSYSFHPLLLATYFSPFILGNPYPTGSVELMGYVGLLPLALAGWSLWHSRRKEKWFFGGLVLAGTLLAFGRWNPLYTYLRHIPLLNLFRVPARYLYWVSLGLATLAAIGFDAIPLSTAKRKPTVLGLITLAVLIGGVLALVWTSQSADALVTAWHWIPLLLVAGLLALFTLGGQFGPAYWRTAACVLLLVDLYAYGAVLDRTYNAAVPIGDVTAKTRSGEFLAQDPSLYRIYTKEEIMPALSVMRESQYPDMGMGRGLQSANIYMPLVPSTYEAYLQMLNARQLDRLNAKYYLIPQLLPVDEASELYDVQNPFSALPVNNWVEIPPQEVAGLKVESYLSHAADLPNGELVAEILLANDTGQTTRLPLRAGVETAEWAYERGDVRANIAHSIPEIATTWSARSGFPPEDHPGHTYIARFTPDEPLSVTKIMIRLYRPEAFVRIEKVRLQTPSGEEHLLSHLLGLGDYSIVYRSEDVLIYRNEDVFPRAYAIPTASVTTAGGSLSLPDSLTARDIIPVQIEQYSDTMVRLQVNLPTEGYVILSDLCYPGWEAEIDGVRAPILAADNIFRAVAVHPGIHEITYTYHPWRLSH